ncbi:hypothetical protein WME98_45515 [Sorangium sp. So ce296]|uniref:hypothetical protein n=1 Tax=Sorangium sp. So ce296 TaxID=3133296 RepID=UPI003F5DF8F0
MLIYLDRSAIADAIGGGATAEKSCECIELLLRMHREGLHIVAIAPEHIEAFAPMFPRLSRRERSTLERIRGTSLELLSLKNRLDWYIELGVGTLFDGKEQPVGSGSHVIRASLHHFDRSTRAIRAVLLGENLIDVDLYAEMAQLLLAVRNLRKLRLQVERRGAGGSTLAPEFTRIADDGRIVLAIADSDRRYPDGPPGGTWSELEKKAQGRPAFQRAREVHGREAENLVPLDVYDAALAQKSAKDPRLSIVADLRRLAEVHRAHADIKDGIRLYQVEHTMKAGEREFWSDVSAELRRDRCQQPESKCQERAACGCFVVEGLGAHVLKQTVEWLRREGPRRTREVARLFDLPQDAKLAQLAGEVVAWGCALPEMLT